MTRSFPTLLIFPLLSLLTVTWIMNCSTAAFLPRSSTTRQIRYGPVVLQLSDDAATDETANNNRPLSDRQHVLQQKLTKYFERLASDDVRSRAPLSKDDECEKYLVTEKFMDDDVYWKQKVQTEQFGRAFEKGFLYRPQVVNDLYVKVKDALNMDLPSGIMMKGPHGIGKSHTLVNLVRKLLYGSDGKYLVTFIPDCSFFETESDLVEAICYSFGSTAADIVELDNKDKYDVETLIDDIDSILKDMDKQWILIFDQINSIFARPEFEKVKDLTTISLPFRWILLAINPGRVTSIISTSVNNENSYKEKQEFFEDYSHPLSMDLNEFKVLYPEFTESENEVIMEATGRVPLQVSKLIDAGLDVEKYEEEEKKLIVESIEKLRDDCKKMGQEDRFEEIKKAAIACYFGIPVDIFD